MTAPRKLSEWGILLLIATVAGCRDTPPRPPVVLEQTPAATAPTDMQPLRKLGKMDLRHPLHVGSDYYPKLSLENNEQGMCTLSFFIEADGAVTAAQLLKSSGFVRLDTACLESVIDVPLIPAAVNGKPVAGWYDFNVVWVIDHTPPYPSSREPAFPRVADDYEFHAGEKFYPAAAREKHEKGYCVVRITVGSSGTALNASITHATGSATLDQACLLAVEDARFTPAVKDGRPVPDSTDIAIYW